MFETQNDLNQLMQKTKGQLFYQKNAGFLGALLCKLRHNWATDIPTAAIGAEDIYWNPDFFLALSKEMRVTVLAHELWHNAMMHGSRRGERCPDIWNVAADHVINNLLVDHGYIFDNWMDPNDPFYQKEPWCLDPKYKGWSTEDVYDDLINDGQMQPFSGQVQIVGIGSDIIDVSKDNAKVQIANVIGAMTVAHMSKEAGNVPGEVKQIVDEFLNPQLPWETILYNFFNALTSQEYSYSRPNRRYEDPLLPGITGRNGLEHLVYFIDSSGSITDEQIIRVNTEIKFIQEEIEPEKLTIVVFDTVIHTIREFEREEPYEKIEITGRGGTDLRKCWQYLEDTRPTAAVVFTDLYVDIPPNPGVPIIWIAVDNHDIVPEYGQLIHLDMERKGP